jgi:hypothetical protein
MVKLSTSRAAAIVTSVIALLAAAPHADARGPRPAAISADLVFDDSATNKVRSDGAVSAACGNDLNASRYCAAAQSVVGPECSSVSYATIDGDYAFRTRTSETCTPPAGQRRAELDFADRIAGSTCSVSKTEGASTKMLDLCSGPQLIDDVRIEAEHLFAVANGGASVVSIYLALHSPPDANTTHFVIQYTTGLAVAINDDGSRTLSTAYGDTANLYDITFNKSKTKVTKTLIGVYHLPVHLTAKAMTQ